MPTLSSAVVVAPLLWAALEASSATFERQRPDDGVFASAPSGGVLYSQLDDPSGSAFLDQAFEAVYAGYSSEGADDFEVTGVAGWDILTINTPGVFTEPGASPLFVNHYFYADGGPQPGAVLCSFPANTNFQSAGDGDISTTVECNLDLGPHWFSQQVRLDFQPFGQHFWATRSSAANFPATFRNPGNGLGTGNCVDWAPANSTCGMVGRDYLFELLGEPRQVPPIPALGRWGVFLTAVVLFAASAYILWQPRP